MKNAIFVTGLIMLIYSCGKDIANAVASNPSNVTNAPYRISRGTIDPTSSNSIKDAVCDAEFGDDYVAGHAGEYSALVMNQAQPAGITTAGISFANSTATLWNAPIGTAYVFCIHK